MKVPKEEKRGNDNCILIEKTIHIYEFTEITQNVIL